MSLGTVLVTGGCGFVGFHVVQALQEDADCTRVHVLSRNPNRNRLPGVFYHAGDVMDAGFLRGLLAEIRPRVIIHTASPVAASGTSDEKSFYDINVQGTQNLLTIAAEASVQAFVYTSSVNVMNGPSFCLIEEDAPLLAGTGRTSDHYSKTKALADSSVLKANGTLCPSGSHLKTTCLRVASVYGERDNQLIPGLLRTLKEKRHLVQIGDNKNLFDFVSVENVAMAHILAAKCLIAQTNEEALEVDGQAFFITDSAPLAFWDFARKVWAVAGDTTPLDKVIVMPAWLALALASAVEWAYWIFTLGQKRPNAMRRHIIEYTCTTRTFSISKARKRLGYAPVANMDENIAKGVKWAMEESGTAEARTKKIS